MTTAQEALNFNHMFNEFLLIKGSISGIVGDEKKPMGGPCPLVFYNLLGQNRQA